MKWNHQQKSLQRLGSILLQRGRRCRQLTSVMSATWPRRCGNRAVSSPEKGLAQRACGSWQINATAWFVLRYLKRRANSAWSPFLKTFNKLPPQMMSDACSRRDGRQKGRLQSLCQSLRAGVTTANDRRRTAGTKPEESPRTKKSRVFHELAKVGKRRSDSARARRGRCRMAGHKSCSKNLRLDESFGKGREDKIRLDGLRADIPI